MLKKCNHSELEWSVEVEFEFDSVITLPQNVVNCRLVLLLSAI